MKRTCSTRSRILKLNRFTPDGTLTLFGDTVAEMSEWDCFKPKARSNDKSERGPLTSLGMLHRDPSRKIGRNDPCPCGSRKKFKKCCLNAAHESFSAGDPPLEPAGPRLRDR